VALCDCNPERLKAAAVTRSGARTYEDGGIYSDPDVEAISTHTGDPFHRDPFIKAVQAGKHVLIEKPLANTEQDVLDMVMAYDRAVPGLKV
jgi:predicted dehydrogenase